MRYIVEGERVGYIYEIGQGQVCATEKEAKNISLSLSLLDMGFPLLCTNREGEKRERGDLEKEDSRCALERGKQARKAKYE